MVKHMVMWSFKEEIPEEKKAELKAQMDRDILVCKEYLGTVHSSHICRE